MNKINNGSKAGAPPSPSWIMAGPSFVWPAPVGENCRLLEGLVQEVGLVFFETGACLAYNNQDLPPYLARLNLRYHLHLPLDLPWEQGGKQVADVVDQLGKKVDFLSPWSYVLHPPDDPKTFLEFWHHFSAKSNQPLLLIENIEQNDLQDLWSIILKNDLYLCLDLGHLLVYKQEDILSLPKVFEKIKMLHIYGALSDHRHSSLGQLSQKGQETLLWLLQKISHDCVLVLEVFSLKQLKESLAIFWQWITDWNLCHTSGS